jgi:large subunit ribosomal protein L30
MLKVRLRRSPIGTSPRQRETLRCLGLRRVGKSVILKDSPAVRGMVRAVAHLVEAEE